MSWFVQNRLVIVLLFAFSIMSLISYEQQRVIMNQQTLIHQLFDDSLQLSVLRAHVRSQQLGK